MASSPLEWTPQRVLALRELAKKNLSVAEIAEKLHRNERAIIRAARQFDIDIKSLGRNRTTWTPDEVASLQRLAAENLPVSIISKKIGRTESAIKAKAHELSVTLRRPRKKRF